MRLLDVSALQGILLTAWAGADNAGGRAGSSPCRRFHNTGISNSGCSTVHLWTAFAADSSAVRLLSADFTELPTIYVSVYIAGRSIRAAFQGVTPSFRLSDNQFADCDSSLPFYQRLTFSVRNKSHDNIHNIADALWKCATEKRMFPAKSSFCRMGKCQQCRWTRETQPSRALS